MWKYLTLVSLVLVAAAAFVFRNTHTGMSAAQGEVASLQALVDAAAAKNKEAYMDRTIAAYAKLRGAWLQERKSEVVSEKAKYEQALTDGKSEIERLTNELHSLGGESEEGKKKLRQALQDLATSEDLNNALDAAREKDGLEVLDMDPEDPGFLENLAANLRNLEAKKMELAEENTRAESEIDLLSKRKTDVSEQIEAADALAKERQARVSPKELNCSVAVSDPNWDYVIVDAGLNDGVIIGSHLAVMRSGEKVCELTVTLVEQSRSSCDVVASTLKAGERVKVGDRVVSVRNENKQ